VYSIGKSFRTLWINLKESKNGNLYVWVQPHHKFKIIPQPLIVHELQSCHWFKPRKAWIQLVPYNYSIPSGAIHLVIITKKYLPGITAIPHPHMYIWPTQKYHLPRPKVFTHSKRAPILFIYIEDIIRFTKHRTWTHERISNKRRIP
jgi:hypothetical protein